MSEHTRTLDRFKYHLEDIECDFCLHSKPKRKVHKKRCREEACRFEDIRQEAIENGRTKRKRGFFSMQNHIVPREVACHAQ
ncbi:MAG: hypothetical protein FWC20_09665 [Oscillospiraceae bacterium]|nr:hypothetical protein [Oscillospiraceae bacterium]MCL2279655.1 hypothetical protein [Oscillospiraceae bacterium]